MQSSLPRRSACAIAIGFAILIPCAPSALAREPAAGITLELVPAGSGAEIPATYARLSELCDAAATSGKLRIALPIGAQSTFEALEIDDVRIALDPAKHAASVTGRSTYAGSTAEIAVAVAWSKTGGPAQWIVGLRPSQFALAQRVGAPRGTALEDIDLGGGTFVLAAQSWASLAELGDASAWFGGADVALQPGWCVNVSLPVASLPAALRYAPGFPASGSIHLAGAIDADIGLLSGRGSAKSLQISAAIPGAGEVRNLPAWITPIERGERRLTIAYEAPSKVTVGVGCDVQAEIGGEKRAFRLSASGGNTSAAEFQAEMVSPWKAPFGLTWIDLSSATLKGNASGATLEGRFEIAGHAASASIEIGAHDPTKLLVAIGEIALADLVRSGAIDELPQQIQEPLEKLLDGASLELRSASIALEPKSRTLTLAAQVSFRGTQSDFLYVTEIPEWNGFTLGSGGKSVSTNESKSSSRASFFALRPMHLSLGKLFPRMLQIDALKDIASCDLDIPSIFGGSGNFSVDLPALPDLPSGWSNVFARLSMPSLPSMSAGSAESGKSDSAEASGTSSSDGFGFGKVRFPAGLHLSAHLPMAKLPSGGHFASTLGIVQRLGDLNIDGLDFSGSIGWKLEDLHLAASLPPITANPNLPWLAGGKLRVSIAGTGSLSIDGQITANAQGQPMTFTVTADAQKSAQGSAATLEATYDGTWKHALGIEWLDLEDVRLSLALAEGNVAAKCGASFPIGARQARVEVALAGKDSTSILAKLDKAALSDVLALAGKSGNGGALEKTGLDTALALSDLEIEIRRAQQKTILRFACTTQIAGQNVDLFASIEPRDVSVATAVAIRLPDTQLGALIPALHGTAGDLRFPSATISFGTGFGGEGSKLDASATEIDLKRWISPSATDNGLAIPDGLHFAGSLPLASLPQAVRQAVGASEGAQLVLEGPVNGALGALTGRGAAIQAFELRASIPSGNGAARLPSFVRPVAGSERSLVLAYAAPSNVSLGVACEVEADLGGEARRFRLAASGGNASAAEFQAEMVSPWKAPFGLTWIDLSSATLKGNASGATLEGRFEIAGHAASASIEIGAHEPTKLLVAIGEIALADLVKSGAVDKLPQQIQESLEKLLDGAALELRSASIALEPKSRTLTLAAQVSFRGTQSDFLYVTEIPEWNGFTLGSGGKIVSTSESKSSSRASFFALKPMQLSLGKLFPRMLQIDALKDIAGCDLDIPSIFGGSGNFSVDLPALPDLPSGWSNVFANLSMPSLPEWPSGSSKTDSTGSSGSSNGFSFGKLKFPSGLNLSARLPLPKLPSGGRFASTLGIVQRLGDLNIDGLDLSGSIGWKLEDLHLAASLPPISANPKLPWLSGGKLRVSIAGTGSLSIDGQITAIVQGQPMTFTVTADAQKSAQGSAATLEATYDGTWKHALGIEWLDLEDVRLSLALAEGNVAAKCGASFPIGARQARVEVALAGKDSTSILAKLDKAALSDVLALAGKSGGGGALEKTGLDSGLALSDLELEVHRAQQKTFLRFACTTQIAGQNVDLFASLEPRGGTSSIAVALRLPDMQLGNLVPALRGTPGDLRFPSSTLTLGEGAADGDTKLAADATAIDLKRWIPAGAASGDLVFAKGLRFGGALPMSALPAQVKSAIGLADDAAPLVFSGSIDGTLGALSGRGSAIQKLELRARLPATSGATALPRWMSSVESGPRDLVLAYAYGTGVSLSSTREVGVQIGGATRRFRLVAEARAGGGTASGTFEAEMIEPWPHPFGLMWIDLKQATLRGSLASGGTGGATLSGAFELFGSPATLEAALAFAGQNASGRIAVRTQSFALADIAKLGLAERLPDGALDALGGTQLVVRDPKIAIEIGKERALTLSGRVVLRDMEADVALLVVAGNGGRPVPILALRPDRLSLGAVAPKLLENEATRDIASRPLKGLFVLAGPSAKSLDPADLPAEFAASLPAPSTKESGGIALAPGLNLLAPLGPDALPKDGMLAQALDKMRSAMGVAAGGLAIRGTLGRSASDLNLSIELPPIEPRNAPKWLESGQLSLQITGKPSLAIVGRVGLLVDDQHLSFSMNGALTRVGAAPAIQFFGALESDGPWQSPFGIEWLELERVGLGLALDATASVTPAFAGKMKIGTKDLEIAASVRISPAGVPIGGMFLGKSDAGFALSDLLALQARVGGGGAGAKIVSLLPDITVRDFELKLAPHDEPDLHVMQGLAVRGTLFVAMKKGGAATKQIALVDIAISKDGLHALGSISGFKVGPLEFDDADIDIALARGDQHFSISGGVFVLGHEQSLALLVSRELLAFDAQADLGGKWKAQVHVETPLDFEMPKFFAGGILPDDLLGNLKSALADAGEDLRTHALDALVVAQQKLEEAQKRRDERQKALADLKGKLQKAFDAAKDAVDKAQQEAVVARALMDNAKKVWEQTPDDKPVLKAARKKLFDVAHEAYELGTTGKKAIYEAKKKIFEALPKPLESKPVKDALAAVQEVVDQVKSRETALEKLNQALGPVIAFHEKYPTRKLFELEKGDFGQDLGKLAKGDDLPVEYELRWLEETRHFKGDLSFGNLAQSMHAVAQAIFPKLP